MAQPLQLVSITKRLQQELVHLNALKQSKLYYVRIQKASDFRRPGHVFPLIAKEGGVLYRAGHTEAAVDLALLAGGEPAGVICEIFEG
ncbi:hypothetical protein GCM10020331_022520 [Ectobacillus funiculus]